MERLNIEKTIPLNEYSFMQEMINSNSWFNENYPNYRLDSVTINELNQDEINITINISFFYEIIS